MPFDDTGGYLKFNHPTFGGARAIELSLVLNMLILIFIYIYQIDIK